MNTSRRGFFGWLAGGVAAVVGLAASGPTPVPVSIKNRKFVSADGPAYRAKIYLADTRGVVWIETSHHFEVGDTVAIDSGGFAIPGPLSNGKGVVVGKYLVV